MPLTIMHIPAGDVQPGDLLFVNHQWRTVDRKSTGSRGSVFLELLGAHGIRRGTTVKIVIRRSVEAKPNLPEPTNMQPVAVAEFKRALVPDSRWLVTNHYITREDHGSFGTTERTVTRTSGSHYYMSRPSEDPANTSGIPWPKRGQVQRADGGIFLVYGGGTNQADDELFLTFYPQS